MRGRYKHTFSTHNRFSLNERPINKRNIPRADKVFRKTPTKKHSDQSIVFRYVLKRPCRILRKPFRGSQRYYDSVYPVVFTFTESYAAPIVPFLQKWMSLLREDVVNV